MDLIDSFILIIESSVGYESRFIVYEPQLIGVRVFSKVVDISVHDAGVVFFFSIILVKFNSEKEEINIDK